MSRTPMIAYTDDGPDDRPGVEVRTPYREDFVEALKKLVPSRDRAWWADAKTWWVAQEHSAEVLELAVATFGTVELVDEDGVYETITADGARWRQEGLGL